MTVLFVSPHPDDIELFCGGTFLVHYHQKHSLHVCMATSGGMGTLRPDRMGKKMEKIREGEAHARYAELTTVGLTWLKWPDGKVHETKEKVTQAKTLLQKISPNLIYLPEIGSRTRYKHQDHQQTTMIFEKALGNLKRPVLRYYHTRDYNIFVDVTSHVAENKQALSHYKSQAGLWANPPYLLQLVTLWQHITRTRQGKLFGCEQAETFRQVNPQPG